MFRHLGAAFGALCCMREARPPIAGNVRLSTFEFGHLRELNLTGKIAVEAHEFLEYLKEHCLTTMINIDEIKIEANSTSGDLVPEHINKLESLFSLMK